MTKPAPLNDRSLIDREWLARRIKEGRGQGEDCNWRPFQEVRDVSSRGWSYRVPSWLNNHRCLHLLSRHELNYYLTLIWQSSVVGIYEQVPLLDIDAAVDIADELNIRYPIIRHPTKPGRRMMPILTSDFRLSIRRNSQIVDVIRTVKPVEHLRSYRVQQKFDIERVYWQRRNLDWGIITDADIPRTLAENVWLVYNHRNLDSILQRCAITESQLQAIDETLWPAILNQAILNVAALDCDRTLGLPPGTSLSVTYHFIASRHWPVDMHVQINPSKPLPLLHTA